MCLPTGHIFGSIYKRYPHIQDLKPLFDLLGFSESLISTLYRQFKRIRSTTGLVEVSRILEHYDLDDSELGRRIFSIFDSNPKRVDFRCFVVCLWNICTLDTVGLVNFGYDLLIYSPEDILSNDSILSALYGDRLYDRSTMVRINRMVGCHPLGDLGRQEFLMFCERFPSFLTPLHNIQCTLRARVLGTKVWSQLSDIRFKNDCDKKQSTLLDLCSTPGAGKDCREEPTQRLENERSSRREKVISTCREPYNFRLIPSNRVNLGSDHSNYSMFSSKASDDSSISSPALEPRYRTSPSCGATGKPPTAHPNAPPNTTRPPLPKTVTQSDLKDSSSLSTNSKSKSPLKCSSSREHTPSDINFQILQLDRSDTDDRDNLRRIMSDVSSLTDPSFASVPSSPEQYCVIQISKLVKKPHNIYSNPARNKVIPTTFEPDFGI
mmetsp:Transcript_12948/g.19485  ORF Transcript_12948/g.19485 Transcript_12948/m.19485 type:complete len:436 (-) Transcript_12948:263-1570(-)